MVRTTLFRADRFESAHDAFRAHVFAKSGSPFDGFDNRWLVDTELAYKHAALGRGREALRLARWPTLRRRPGARLDAALAACHPSISQNLMENRYGDRGNSASPLYRSHTASPAEQSDLERELDHFFLGGPADPDFLAPRFDRLVTFVKEKRLGCKWPFFAYLAFLLDGRRYVPLLPGRFEKALQYYGADVRLQHDVRWDNYAALLDLIDWLRERLEPRYGRLDAIHIHSYVWIVSGRLPLDASRPADAPPALSPDEILRRRQEKAARREETGLAGELYVLDSERERLTQAGRPDLAQRVVLVSESAADAGAGYDVLSFTDAGDDLHIEVKSTSRLKGDDGGFWLSENERSVGETDPSWHIVRVWDVHHAPHAEDLGNVVRATADGWLLAPASWFVSRKRAPATP